MFQFAATR